MIVLLTGHRKSGTTLLHRFFDNNKDFNVYPNDFCYFYMFFPGYAEKYKKNKSAAIKRLININRIKLKNFCKQYNYPLINLKKNNLLLKNHFKKKIYLIKKYYLKLLEIIGPIFQIQIPKIIFFLKKHHKPCILKNIIKFSKILK